jgi:3-deoxy-D-manno-octulosonic-acid transferase
MSHKSALRYARWRGLARPAFAGLAAVCAQSGADAERLRTLGAARVEVTGNLKFDVEPDAALLAAGAEWRRALERPVLLLASTREGEEPLLLGALPARDASLLVLVVPRHPQRFDEVARWAQARRTRDERPPPGTRIYLGDTMGEMAFYFAACDVAVIGGSFVPVGGQNLIEGLAAGVPVIAGPSMFNFAEATRLAVQAGAALQVNTAGEAIRLALELMKDEEKRTAMSAAGKALCAAHRGATARHVAVCRSLISA